METKGKRNANLDPDTCAQQASQGSFSVVYTGLSISRGTLCIVMRSDNASRTCMGAEKKEVGRCWTNWRYNLVYSYPSLRGTFNVIAFTFNVTGSLQPVHTYWNLFWNKPLKTLLSWWWSRKEKVSSIPEQKFL